MNHSYLDRIFHQLYPTILRKLNYIFDFYGENDGDGCIDVNSIISNKIIYKAVHESITLSKKVHNEIMDLHFIIEKETEYSCDELMFLINEEFFE